MLDFLQNQLLLPGGTLLLLCSVALVAGMVRGFSGFGLSALIMAVMAVSIPPIMLIPICFILEASASLVMFRGGMIDGDRALVIRLVAGYTVGIPIGLAATYYFEPDTSRLIALLLILVLALLQALKLSPGFLRQQWGMLLAGFCAGIATGLASVGGMVIALYVLALHKPAREVRGSLVLFLFISMAVSTFWLVSTGILDKLALTRGLFLAPVVIAGVLMGTWLFRPSLEQFYKRFCLFLLVILAAAGLVRLLMI